MFINNEYINDSYIARISFGDMEFSKICKTSIFNDGRVAVVGEVAINMEVELTTGSTIETSAYLGRKTIIYEGEDAESLFRNPKAKENLQPARVYLKYLKKASESGIYERKVDIAKERLSQLLDLKNIPSELETPNYEEVLNCIKERKVMFWDAQSEDTNIVEKEVEDFDVVGDSVEASSPVEAESLMQEPNESLPNTMDRRLSDSFENADEPSINS